MNPVTSTLRETPVKKIWKAAADKELGEQRQPLPIFSGPKQKLIRVLIWINILKVAFRTYKNPLRAIKETKRLLRFRNHFRNGHHLHKFAHIDGRYFFTYNAPGWPSVAFNRYIKHHLKNNGEGSANNSIHSLLFGITKKCGFKCEHCCEWEHLNLPEQLSQEDLLLITNRFRDMGVTQVQLSGGEPLNRFQDILFLLSHAKKDIDFWMLTSGYNLSVEKAVKLKEYGLTGITISLDHCEESLHDAFRGVPGSFQRALHAAACARHAELAVCFSICTTSAFISRENVIKYAVIAKDAGASFIQFLEPRAVGHYRDKPVVLNNREIAILEEIYEDMNYRDRCFDDFPIISYHGYYSRRLGCSGSGKDYVYVDTDGDVHSCPFCQKKLFSAFDDDLQHQMGLLKQQGCKLFANCSKKNLYESL
jgi:MoaA/NifB/PqqE/SkfB family radical SAM enzyme